MPADWLAVVSYTPAAFSNRLDQIAIGGTPARTLTHSASGQITADDRGGVAYAYAYDNSDRLTGVTVGGAATAAYVHNALGQRVSKDAGGVVTHFHYDRAGRLIAETAPDGLGGFTLVKEYVDVDGLPLAVIEPGSGSGIAAETPLDNDDAGTAGTGLWTAETARPGHLGAGYRTRRGGDGTESYTWTPAVPAAGRYQVHARWPELGPEEGSTATYTVTHAGGATPVSVDQRVKGGDWTLLGAFELTPGQNHRIALSDAVDFIETPDPHLDNGAETVIDDFDPSVTLIGPWSNGVTNHYAAPGPGTSRFQWPAPAGPGFYTVHAQWGGSLPTATNVPYIIHHGGGTTTVRVNQQINKLPGVPWNVLGTFHLDPAAGDMVELSNDATPAGSLWYRQKVVADGIRYVHQPVPAGAIIVDNSDAGASTVGTWSLGSARDTEPYWGSSVAFPPSAAGAGANTFTWTPTIPTPGRYHVYARWNTRPNRATNAPYTVHHQSGATEVRVNQELDGGRWNLLGSFEMTPGANHRVVLSDDANEYVIADAVMLVPDTTSRVVAADAIRLVANTAEAPLFVHADHLGTPRRMTDDAQTVVWDHVTRPFGETVSLLGVFENNRRFPGQYFDSETALHYNYFRDYDPALGRYVQSDPIGLRAGLNTYGYVGSRPNAYVDVFGLGRIKGRFGTISGRVTNVNILAPVLMQIDPGPDIHLTLPHQEIFWWLLRFDVSGEANVEILCYEFCDGSNELIRKWEINMGISVENLRMEATFSPSGLPLPIAIVFALIRAHEISNELEQRDDLITTAARGIVGSPTQVCRISGGD